MIRTTSETTWTLSQLAGAPATAEAVERISDEIMESLLDMEEDTNGRIANAAVSAVAAKATVTIEFTVEAETIEDADLLANEAVKAAIGRAGHIVNGAGSKETSRGLALA